MNGIGCVINLTKSDFGCIICLTLPKKISILENMMNAKTFIDLLLAFLLLTPIIGVFAFTSYKLALDILGIAYGLIY